MTPEEMKSELRKEIELLVAGHQHNELNNYCLGWYMALNWMLDKMEKI